MNDKVSFVSSYTYDGLYCTIVSIEQDENGFYLVKNDYDQCMYKHQLWELCLKWILNNAG